ncbi:SPP1 family predicted phage head-tail adaptor [Mycoplana dimorpha]|uniref:SPP1 family predicted phage head-tail adaptor n=2 Tax=Mycoplana dimorpha TaxID=28320 RepID=A0A2T5BI56_MYCDI|nr:SPP1 family predicted phage head-tail adaptor [Mycoplana dimorpha]
MTVTHRIWLRHRSDLQSGMRLRKGARVFDLKTFRDPDETGRYLICECEEMEGCALPRPCRRQSMRG